MGRYTKWPDQGTLVIARPGTDDDGMYQCKAVNQFGVAESVVINVKRAELGDFQYANENQVKVRLGSSTTLQCNVPVGFPPPVVTWLTNKNSQIQYLKETNRRATDINGYLHIATVIHDDHNTVYTCVANNEILRVQKSGPSYRIEAEEPVSTYNLRILYRSPKSEVVAVGDVLQLKCIYGGNPEPQYSWFKNDQETIKLPNVMVKNMGTMLEINPVSLEAAGEYRCQGTNEVTRNSMHTQFTVTVKVRPTFIEKPVDTTVPVNGSVIFRCIAHGDPPPQIRWTVNGQRPSFYLDGVRKILQGNVMYLRNLTVKDTVVIQCNATNQFGYAFTNAYVNVMREPPYFIKPPQTETRAVDGSEVNLFCQTFSAPKAIISWTKDKRPINGGRYQILTNGDLRIKSVSTTDTGYYECTATNPFGSQKASGRLFVRRKTRIVLPPKNTRVYENDVVKFVCTAETDASETHNLKIVWYKDDNLIEPHLTPRIQTVLFDYALVLSGAQPRDTGHYTCNASNGLDYDTASALLLVQGRPEQAINLQVNCVDFINEELALVTWYPGSDNYSPIMEYIVEYCTQYEPETWYPAEIFNLTGLVQSTSIKVVLRPHILYKFRVRTRNRVGVSLPSLPTIDTCSIPGRVPSANPKELYVFGSLRNNLIIRWTTLPYIEHNANNLGYLLTVQCLNCDIIPFDSVNSTIIGDWRTDRITYTSFRVGVNVYEIETYKQFQVTIKSRNEKGVSKSPATVAIGYSGEAIPTIAPDPPVVIQPTSTGALLQWTILQASQEVLVNGFFRGYRIEWCDASLDSKSCTQNMRFQDLILRTPNTPVLNANRYRRSTSNDMNDDDELDVLDQISPRQDRLESYLTQDSKLYHKQITGIDPYWNKDSDPICESNPTRNVSCPGAGEFPRALQSKSIMKDAYEHLLTRLPRNTQNMKINKLRWGMSVNFSLTGVPGASKIKCWTRILNNRFAGPASVTVQFETDEGIPGPVSDLRADSTSVNYVDISWIPPTELNGVILGYDFEAVELKGLEIGFGFRYPRLQNSTVTKYRLVRLKPDTNYRINVRAFTSVGTGLENFIDLKTAPSDRAPNPPSFIITEVRANGFTVLYEPSHIGLGGTVFFVQYRQPGVIYWFESIPNFINRTIHVDSLLSDTYYQVRMVATNGASMSAASSERIIRTLGPLNPSSLIGTNAIWLIMDIFHIILFVLLICILVIIRKRRLSKIQEKVNNPFLESQHSLLSPEYAQPADENTRPIYNNMDEDYSNSEDIQSYLSEQGEPIRAKTSGAEVEPDGDGLSSLSDRDPNQISERNNLLPNRYLEPEYRGMQPGHSRAPPREPRYKPQSRYDADDDNDEDEPTII